MAARLKDSVLKLSDSESDLDSDDQSGSEGIEFKSGVKRAEIQRKRRVLTCKDPEKRTRQQRKRGKKNVKKITVYDRISSFPGNYFEMHSGRLFCGACSELLSTEDDNHKDTCSNEEAKGEQEPAAITATEGRGHPRCSEGGGRAKKVGEMLPDARRTFRVSVVETFLLAGVSLKKVDCFLGLLEQNGCRLTQSSALSELIPTVRSKTKICARI